MAQASFQWRQLINSDSKTIQSDRPSQRLGLNGVKSNQGWWIGLAVVVALLVWHWQLLLAIAIGSSIAIAVNGLQQGVWQCPDLGWSRLWSSLWNSSNRPLTTAVVTGGMAALGTYLVTAIWVETEKPWLTIGLMLQGCGTLAILSLLLRQNFIAPQHSPVSFDQSLSELSHPDPLQRLLAVRKLTRQVTEATAPHAKLRHSAMSRRNASIPAELEQRSHLIDCFRLMLKHERELIVRNALVESLRMLEGDRRLAASSAAPVQIPTRFKQPAVVYQRSRSQMID